MCEDKMCSSLRDCKKPKWQILWISIGYIIALAVSLIFSKDIKNIVIFVLCLTMTYFVCIYFVYRLSDFYEECCIQEYINNKRKLEALEERINNLENETKKSKE